MNKPKQTRMNKYAKLRERMQKESLLIPQAFNLLLKGGK